MKIFLSVISYVCLLGVIHAQTDEIELFKESPGSNKSSLDKGAETIKKNPAELDAILERYRLEFDALRASEAGAIAPVRELFIQDLTKLKKDTQAKGDLNGVLAYENLIVDAGADRVAAPPTESSPGLISAYANYLKNKAAALKSIVGKQGQLESGYVKDLTILEQKFTRAGQIEDAKLAREAKLIIPGAGIELLSNFSGVTLKADQEIKSPNGYKPPVEIEWRLQSDREIRLSYAFDQMIFNWGNNKSELRIDGGPVSGKHKKGAGEVPKNRPLVINLNVQLNKMTVSVNGQERATWEGDFSKVSGLVGVRATSSSTIKIDQVIVRKGK